MTELSGYGSRLLLDNSAWARVGLGRLPEHARERWERAVRADELVVCPPFALEALYSARDAEHFGALEEELGGFQQVEADEVTFQRARLAQHALAQDPSVPHRVKPNDLFLAAVADQRALGVLHYDHDYDILRRHTPLEYRSVWITQRGSVP